MICLKFSYSVLLIAEEIRDLQKGKIDSADVYNLLNFGPSLI